MRPINRVWYFYSNRDEKEKRRNLTCPLRCLTHQSRSSNKRVKSSDHCCVYEVIVFPCLLVWRYSLWFSKWITAGHLRLQWARSSAFSRRMLFFRDLRRAAIAHCEDEERLLQACVIIQEERVIDAVQLHLTTSRLTIMPTPSLLNEWMSFILELKEES